MEADLQMQRLLALEARLSAVEQQQQSGSKRDAVQFVSTLLVIAITLFGVAGLVSWQNAKLTESIEKRIELLEKHIEQSDQNTTARMEDLRRDLTARFDDLKQIVLAQRKQPTP
jgi:hypothetical protein